MPKSNMSHLNPAGVRPFTVTTSGRDLVGLFAFSLLDQHYGCYGWRFPPTLAILMLTKLLLDELMLAIVMNSVLQVSW